MKVIWIKLLEKFNNKIEHFINHKPLKNKS